MCVPKLFCNNYFFKVVFGIVFNWLSDSARKLLQIVINEGLVRMCMQVQLGSNC